MSCIYLRAPPSIFTSKRVVRIIAVYWPISALSPRCLRCWYFVSLLSALFSAWLASPTHTSPFCLLRRLQALWSHCPWSWEMAWSDWNTGEYWLKKKQKKTASEKEWNLFYHLHYYNTQGRKHSLLLLLLKQLANVHWFDVDVSINHTYQEPLPQI